MNLILDTSSLWSGRVTWRVDLAGAPAAPRYRLRRNGLVVVETARTMANDGFLWPGESYEWTLTALNEDGSERETTAPQGVTVPLFAADPGGPVAGIFIDFPDVTPWRSSHQWKEYNASEVLASLQLAADRFTLESRGLTQWGPLSSWYIMAPRPLTYYQTQWDWKAAVLDDIIPFLPDVPWTNLHRAVLDIAPGNGSGGKAIPGSVVGGQYFTSWLAGSPAVNLGEIMHEAGHSYAGLMHAGSIDDTPPDWVSALPGQVHQYADEYDFMGNGGGGCFSWAEGLKMGWRHPEETLEVREPGIYTLMARRGAGIPQVLVIRLDAVTVGFVEYDPAVRLRVPPYYPTVPSIQPRVRLGAFLDRSEAYNYPGGMVDTVIIGPPITASTVNLTQTGVTWTKFGLPEWAITPIAFRPDSATVAVGPYPPPQPTPPPEPIPTVTIKQPHRNAKIKSGHAVTFEAQATDAKTLEWGIDGVAAPPKWKPTKAQKGPHTISVVAMNGPWSATDKVMVTVT